MLLSSFEAIFSWAMASPELSALELEDEKGWHLVYRYGERSK